MKNDAGRMAVAGENAADAVAHFDAVVSLDALHWPVVDREGDRVAPTQRNNLDPTLHAGSLLREYEFAARKVLTGLGEQYGHLNWEGEIAVEVLVQAIVVARLVLKKQRRRANLTGIMAGRQIARVRLRVSSLIPHPFIPLVGNEHEASIQRGAQALQQSGQRILEVAVLAFAETVAGHDDAAAKMLFVSIESGNLGALSQREQFPDDRVAIGVQFRCDGLPVINRYPILDR